MSELRQHGRGPADLQVSGVSAFYGPIAAVRDVSLSVEPGSIVGILGPNGAGKSTLLTALAGFLRTTGGVRLGGRPIENRSPIQRRRSGLAMVPQQQAVIADLSVGDNLRLSWLTGSRSSSFADLRDQALEVFPELAGRLDEPAGNLSGGQRQMLAVSRGLVAAPSVLLLDEPTAGLSPKLISELVGAILTLNSAGLTLLLVEQNYSVVERTCSYAHVLNGGRVTWHGPTDSIDRDAIGDLYAGLGQEG
jgi:branched-chain amino acid transport system ATP-binding protein